MKFFAGCFLLVVLLAAPLFTYAQESFPNKVVQITRSDADQPNEVSIAINPKNPNEITAVSMQRDYPDGLRGITDYAYASFDGGQTWTTRVMPNPEHRTQGDDALTYSNTGKGIVYHSYISFNQLRTPHPLHASNGIFISSSTDNGMNWSTPVPVIDHINTVAPFEDKPYLITDNNPDSPYYNNLYLTWTQFDVYGSHNPTDSTQIYFSRSTDGGRNFLMPQRISDTGGDAIDSSNTVEGAVPCVAENGNVYVVWAGPKGLLFDKSTDGGRHFGKNKVIGNVVGGWDFPIKGIDRANGMPVTAVDNSSGRYHGSIYVNWVDQRNGDPDVFIKYSRDEGKSWSHAIRVNDDKVGNGKDQFFTWMAVDPVDGSINIIFYDRRNSNDNTTALTLARSTDGGKTFRNFKVNLKPFKTSANVFFGDYSGIAAYDGHVVPVFMHFTNKTDLAVSVALFHFQPGTMKPMK
ncbi:MAG TPA: sialidase family protein [Balneolales bacterium]|nr:sialidase family protein [Balneolales bacterium]